MKKLKLNFTILFFLLINLSVVQAQVTIGSNNPPHQGALLDLKEYELTDGQSVNGSSTNKGLGMPRVELVVLDKLFPMFDGLNGADKYTKDGVDYNKAKEDSMHIGLTVYNLKLDPVENLLKGIYFWDGGQWVMAGRNSITGLKFFYMPSINIPFSTVTPNLTINLYDEYVRQFTNDTAADKNPTFVSSDTTIERIPGIDNNRLFNADELTYIVTYYDKNVMKVNDISDTGLMSYDIVSIKTTADSYINIVFVIK